MNIFFQELRFRRLSTLIWSAVMVGFMYMSMAKYDALAKDAAASQQLMDAFPDTIKAVFGMTGLDIASVPGYFGICFIFIAVLLAIHGGLLGVSVVGHEETDRTTEFLYVKPRPRAHILIQKILAGFLLLIIVWAATSLGSIGSITHLATMAGFHHDFAWFLAAALVIHLTAYVIGVFAASSLRTTRAERIIAIVVAAWYGLYVLAKLTPDLAWMHYGSLFSYFDAADILHSHSLKIHYVIGCLVASLALIILSYLMHERRDLCV